jgi:hypothetical protein
MKRGRSLLALGAWSCVLCALAGEAAGAGDLGVSSAVINLGGGARAASTVSLSNDALGDFASGVATSANGRFRLEPSGANYRPIGPTAEVSRLHVDGPADDALVVWSPDPEAEAYHLYRGATPSSRNPPPPIFDAHVCDIPETQLREWENPPPGEYYAYVVTAVNAFYESDLGTDSLGSPRVLGTPCP